MSNEAQTIQNKTKEYIDEGVPVNPFALLTDDPQCQWLVNIVRRDYRSVVWNVQSARCRRSVPPWALPNELWRILLCFNSHKCNAPGPMHLGLGFELSDRKFMWFKALFV